MKSPGKWLQNIPFYPLVLSIYPVLFLWAANYVQVHAFVVLRSLIISISVTTLVCLACLALLRKLRKSALLAGFLLLVFFFYGQFHDLLSSLVIFGFPIGRHRFTLPFWGILLVVGILWILRTRSDLRSLTWTLNLVSACLLALIFLQLGYLALTDRPAAFQNTASAAAGLTQGNQSPDVYYIVLDGYNREDLLRHDIHLDNSGFIHQLEEIGFVVPDCTQSNYSTTTLAMDSTFNLKYIDELGFPYSELAKLKKDSYIGMLKPQILNNQVMNQFREMGYQIITLRSSWLFIDFPNSDIAYDFRSDLGPLQRVEALNFQTLFLRTTLMRVVIEKMETSPRYFKNIPLGILQVIDPEFGQSVNNANHQLYRQYLYQLNSLENIAQTPGKKFLYAHLMLTHTPYVFTAEGDLRANTKDNIYAYGDQVTYLNKRILTIVHNILAQSKTPPIIILQGDHAKGRESAGENAFKVLNAYYLPPGARDKINPNITPVNTFRFILSNYFGKDYPLLPDQSIRIDPNAPGGYEVVPATCVH